MFSRLDLVVAIFFCKEIQWCRRIYSEDRMDHNTDRVKGLVEMQLPENACKLQRYIHALNWMRTALPNLAKVEVPLRT